jgi:hypothetical protein
MNMNTKPVFQIHCDNRWVSSWHFIMRIWPSPIKCMSQLKPCTH